MKSNGPYKATPETLSDFFYCSVEPETVPINTEQKQERGKVYLQTKDLLWSGNTFIKGSNYTLAVNSDNKIEEEMEVGTGVRYFEDNSTIRCRRCNALGHMSFTCPNDNESTRICIYCSSHIHDQFDCPNKMCYRCNRLGHKIQQCPERRIEVCTRCENPGHRDKDCVIYPKEIKGEHVKQAVCMNCRKLGHFTCNLKVPAILPWSKYSTDETKSCEELYENREVESDTIQCYYCGDIHKPSKCKNKPEINPQSSEAIRSRIRQREDENYKYSHKRSSSRERHNKRRRSRSRSRHKRYHGN